MTEGRLRIYLGAAPGVGKTFAMLSEGRRRASRGTDVVAAFVETHDRVRVADELAQLEAVPRRMVSVGGSCREEMDVDAVLLRAPEVALVDDLAHTNLSGSRNEKRWQDVHELLSAGIDVVSTLNVQHLESLSDVVEQITSIVERETIPDHVVRTADQVELVDMAPEAIRRRMAHGNIYPPDMVDAALANYFRPGNLGALRELALLWVADRVDAALLQYRTDHRIAEPWETRERIVVGLTGAPSGDRLIRRAARIAERSRGELIGVHVSARDARSPASVEVLERHRRLLADLGGEYHEVVAADVVVALVDFARRENASQLVLGASRRSRWDEFVRGSVVNRVVRHSRAVDVHVTSTTGLDDEAETFRSHDDAPKPLPRRRRQVAWLLAIVGTGVLTVMLASTRGTFGQGSQFLLYLVVVLAAGATGGTGPALTASVLAATALNWYFTDPLYTWTIDDAENVLALVVFATVGVLAGILVTALAHRSEDAARGQAEAEALARIAAGMIAAPDPLPLMLDRIRASLGLEGISVHDDPDSPAIATVGTAPDAHQFREIILSNGTLRIRGDLSRDDERILDAFAAQLTAALEQRTLREEAARARALVEADNLRTAILRAVSHDLRTPLSSIKASVTSLLQSDVTWPPDAEREFLKTIDEESDRLDGVVGNLLDASRLEVGAIRPNMRLLALDDVVAPALSSISGLRIRVDVDISPELPLVYADPGLLERAIANLVSNAAQFNPPGAAVRIAASQHADTVELRIIDRGPGIPEPDRVRMFQPFQRLGDTAAGSGVGLGMTVARGIIDAMSGRLSIEDTPGGGLTLTISLQIPHDR